MESSQPLSLPQTVISFSCPSNVQRDCPPFALTLHLSTSPFLGESTPLVSHTVELLAGEKKASLSPHAVWVIHRAVGSVYSVSTHSHSPDPLAKTDCVRELGPKFETVGHVPCDGVVYLHLELSLLAGPSSPTALCFSVFFSPYVTPPSPQPFSPTPSPTPAALFISHTRTALHRLLSLTLQQNQHSQDRPSDDDLAWVLALVSLLHPLSLLLLLSPLPLPPNAQLSASISLTNFFSSRSPTANNGQIRLELFQGFLWVVKPSLLAGTIHLARLFDFSLPGLPSAETSATTKAPAKEPPNAQAKSRPTPDLVYQFGESLEGVLSDYFLDLFPVFSAEICPAPVSSSADN
eukprot:GCRY01006337.1.p1 GENE.GCRY01006337.1~~GCRY01006337.1.p1  ORF type:complete len:349 (+),score=98.83 GCRY01006337.1:1001-2047(+)